MAGPSEHHATEAKRNPLIPVGLTVLAVMVIPLCIYPFGPEGPIKKSHVVFSTGQHRAHFADETLYDEYRGYCFLQARVQLLVVESAEARSDGTYPRPNTWDEETGVPFLSIAITRDPV